MTTDRENRASEPTGSHLAGHPSPDELLGYHERTLSEEAADRVQKHLVECGDCSRVILDFAAFPRIEPLAEGGRLAPEELEEQWRALKGEIERRRKPVWQRHQVLLPLAAAFFAAAIGLGLWGAGLHRQVQVLTGPRADVLVAAELRPEAERTRGGGEVVELPPWAHRVILLLSARPSGEGGTYGIDVFAAGGERVLAGFPVRRTPDGGFTVELPRSKLGSGDLRVELFRTLDGRRTRIAEYVFTIVDSEP